MFGNKNSAVPYVRIGGVDRQSVLTSNANGNTPVKEIGVNANGNLIFSTDLATFKSVLDLKYSQFKSNDENQDDTWETEKSVSMRASGTLEDGTAKETGVVVSKEYVAMVNASMKDNTSTVSQISVSNNDATIYSTDGNSTTYLTVTPTGAKVNDKEIATTSQIPDISGKANLSGGNTFSGTQTFNNGITLANDTAITNASGNIVIATQTGGHTILGDPNGIINIQGSTVRPLYTQNGSGTQTLALYKDIPNYFTTAGKTGGNTSGGLKLTAGHLYRIYVGMGDALLSCLIKMPNPMVEQYWFWGMNLSGHYCRLHISSAGVVTYQYANVGQTNWTDNNSVYISYEDITSKS